MQKSMMKFQILLWAVVILSQGCGEGGNRNYYDPYSLTNRNSSYYGSYYTPSSYIQYVPIYTHNDPYRNRYDYSRYYGSQYSSFYQYYLCRHGLYDYRCYFQRPYHYYNGVSYWLDLALESLWGRQPRYRYSYYQNYMSKALASLDPSDTAIKAELTEQVQKTMNNDERKEALVATLDQLAKQMTVSKGSN